MPAREFLAERQESLEPWAEAIYDESALRWLSSERDSDADRAANGLGRILGQAYGDRWLSDAWTEARGDRARAFAGRIRDAAARNRMGDPEGSLRKSAEAGPAGTPALQARLEFEKIYALHRGLRVAECVDAASRLTASIAHRQYPWLRAQTAIEHATCAAISGREGEALAELKGVRDLLQGSQYRDLRLRAAGILADIQTNSGDPWVIWSVAQNGLAEWWTGAAAPNRAHQFLLDLSQASTYLDYPNTAFLFARASSEMIAATPNSMTEALTRVRAASLANKAHRGADAAAQLQRASEILAAMGPSRTVRDYAPVMDTALAAAELAMNHPEAAIRKLEESRTEAPTATNFLNDFQRSMLLGISYAQVNDTNQAQLYLSEMARRLEQRLRSLATRRERLAALAEARPAFLVQVKLLLDRNDPDSALAVWSSFLNVGAGLELDAANHLATPPKLTLPGQGNWLVFAETGGSYAAWLVRDHAAHYYRIAATAVEIDDMAGRLVSLAAYRERSASDLRNLASRLYALIVDPVAGRMDPSQPLSIIPDGSLAQVPFAMLVDTRGEYLGDKFPIVTASHLAESDAAPISRKLPALIVSNASVPESLAGQFPYLPYAREESLAAERCFPHSTVLSGGDATLDRVLGSAPASEVLHFSGHGFSNGGHGALVLAADSNPAHRFLLTSESIAQLDLSHCQLTVLAACLTAVGERNGPSNPASLVRAFLLAGTREVVASSWSVDSSATQQLFDRFYIELANGRTASDALWCASQWLRGQAGYSHPYYWAAFQIFH